MRKRKLYLSELLQRCTNKLLKTIIKTNNQTIVYDKLYVAINELRDNWLWNYQVKAYTIINNDIIIVISK